MNEHPIHLIIKDDLRRSRLTVFFRALLAIPHLIWLQLWAYVSLVVALIGWVATLITGTLPSPLHRFLAAYVRYDTHVRAYTLLIANPFPGFTGSQGSYPLDLIVAEPQKQNRLTVFFRLLLVLPAVAIAAVYGYLLVVVALLGWFASLATGEMPAGMRNAGALGLRYAGQTAAYAFLLTGAYPFSGPTAAESSYTPLVPTEASSTLARPSTLPSDPSPASTVIPGADLPPTGGLPPTEGLPPR